MNSEPEFDARMKRMAEEHQPALPSANLIWWRARVIKKYEQKRRIERPFVIMRLVAALACLEVFAAVWATYGQHVAVLGGRVSWLLLPLGVVVLTASLVSVLLLWSAATGR